MVLAKRLQKYFTIESQDILLNSIEVLPSLPLAQDYLKLRLSHTLFKTIQIDTIRDTQISSEDQIRWEVNSKLPHPIENYTISTTIFFQDEQTIKALGAALENTQCTKLLTKIQNKGIHIKEITSADKQFIFYKQNIPFYNLPQFLKKINITLGLLSILGTLISGLLLVWHYHTAPTQLKYLQTTSENLQVLETQYTQYLNYTAQQHALLKNRQRLTSILKTLQQLKNTPQEIILDEINFAADQTITIRGVSTSDKAIDQFGKALKKSSRKTTLLASTHSNAQTNFEFFIPPSKVNTKGKNNGDY